MAKDFPRNLKDYDSYENVMGTLGESTPTRNSLSFDEIEHKLNDLIDSYKQSLKNAYKSEDYELLSRNELFKPLPSSYDDYNVLYGNKESSIMDTYAIPKEVSSSATMPLKLDYSFLPASMNTHISDKPFISSFQELPSSSLPLSNSLYSPTLMFFQDAAYKFPSSSGFTKETNAINDLFPNATGYEDHIPSTINDQLTYGNNYSILTRQDPIKFQIDETVTFKKYLNTGISSQLSKQISFLLFELNRLKETNEKLNNELNTSKSELNSAKNQIILLKGKKQSEPERNENLTGLVDEIYRAQKVRDVAMMDRLKEADQVKNFALAFANHKVLGDEQDETSLVRSQSLDDLKITTSKFLQAIADEKEKKRMATEEEIEAILFEKDLIYKQKRDLDNEKLKLSEKLKSETDSKNDLQKKLYEVEKERNQLFNDLNFLQKKFKSLKTSESLYKSLSKEEELHHQFSNKLSQLNSELENKDKLTKVLKMKLEEVRSARDRSSTDNKHLILKCNTLEEQLKSESDQVERLSRLVEVLRRKLKEASMNMQF